MAQDESMGPIVIIATRVEKNMADVPAAISMIREDEIQLGTEQLGLNESLGQVPGLFMLNRFNFARDLRA